MVRKFKRAAPVGKGKDGMARLIPKRPVARSCQACHERSMSPLALAPAWSTGKQGRRRDKVEIKDGDGPGRELSVLSSLSVAATGCGWLVEIRETLGKSGAALPGRYDSQKPVPPRSQRCSAGQSPRIRRERLLQVFERIDQSRTVRMGNCGVVSLPVYVVQS